MKSRAFNARLAAAARAFKAAGGVHPFVRIDGDTVEISERPPNSTNLDEAAMTQAKIEGSLGAPRSA